MGKQLLEHNPDVLNMLMLGVFGYRAQQEVYGQIINVTGQQLNSTSLAKDLCQFSLLFRER